MSYQIEFRIAIRGHNIYKYTWIPYVGQDLICEKDTREDAQEYDSECNRCFQVRSVQQVKNLGGPCSN